MKPSKNWLESEYFLYTATDIARKIGVSAVTVLRWLREYDIPVRSLSSTAELVAKRRTYEEQLRITAKSRAAITGKKRSHADLCKRAIGKQRNAKLSKYEKLLYDRLIDLGYFPIPSFAVDKYNIDLAFPEKRIAIEVNGGNWHSTERRKIKQDNSKKSFMDAERWLLIPVSTRRKDWVNVAIKDIFYHLNNCRTP